MKKLLIVCDNMHVGGIQKSLVNLLHACHEKYEISMMLLYPKGNFLKEIPADVKIMSSCLPLRVLGAHKSDLKKNPFGYVWKAALIVLARLFSKKTAFSFAAITQRTLGEYDAVISFSHPSKEHDLRSCSAEFVLQKTRAKEKICFLHGDYRETCVRSAYTDAVYQHFDKIACCSDSVRQHFLDALPELSERTFTVRNFYDLSLCDVKKEDCYAYDASYINLVTVARLSVEKGIERAICALHESGRRDIRYYLVGEGPRRQSIKTLIAEKGMSERVLLLGETQMPYIYMKNADYLLVPSFHEAAPMVFDEAKLLGLPIIATETTSAEEMVGSDGGVVCENSEEGLTSIFAQLQKIPKSDSSSHGNERQSTQLCELL